MRRKKDKGVAKGALKNLLMRRIKLLKNSRQHYEQNPNLMRNVRMANIEIIQKQARFFPNFLLVSRVTSSIRKIVDKIVDNLDCFFNFML
jgi:hypothetical protein